MERLISSRDTRGVISELSPGDEGLVRRFQEAGGMNQIDYESAEFLAYRRYMFAVARREAELGIGLNVEAILRAVWFAERRSNGAA